MYQLKNTEVNFVVVGKPRVVLKSTRIDDFPVKIQDLLNEHVDIVVDGLPNELPSVRSINDHINLILGASFPSKVVYRINTKGK